MSNKLVFHHLSHDDYGSPEKGFEFTVFATDICVITRYPEDEGLNPFDRATLMLPHDLWAITFESYEVAVEAVAAAKRTA